jgi:protein-tyrosine phosphatase
VLPLADAHVHLLAGLDDGPRTLEEALEMCRIASRDGIRLATALAHQNDRYAAVTPAAIRSSAGELSRALLNEGVDLSVAPAAEVMARPDLVEAWQSGSLMSMGDHGKFLLVEMPHQLFVDLRAVISRLREIGLRVILAHPERTPELLHDGGRIEAFIDLGCLVQISAKSLLEPSDRAAERAVRDWIRRGVVHLLGSDGHSPRRRPPLLAAAVETIRRWAGAAAADRIGSTNGQLVLRGLPLRVAPPLQATRRWWALWS